MATLKMSDLSVGDWVYYDKGDTPYSIRSIYRTGRQDCVVLKDNKYPEGVIGFVDRLTPIPITAEILEMNGWFRLEYQCVWNIEDNQGTSHDGEYVITWFADDGYLTISWGGRDDEVLVERTIMECRVKYIHQLQHALLLAGVEKEINL